MGFQHLSPEERSTRSRIAALQRWSREDAGEQSRRATRGFYAKFERDVDPDGVLPEGERAVLADRAMRAHMLDLALKSAAKRRAA